ncbi:MAG: HypC/HybG/HupF family hydrogenase formation chaperone [Nanobdellota archaeon]
MCLAIPAKILEIDGKKAKVDYGGVKRETQLDFVDANVGDYVLIHAGFAIEVMDEASAMESLSEINEILKAQQNGE